VSEGNKIVSVEAKQVWVRPELQRIEAGSAESNETGTVTDSSSPQRS
jgi:hypothetical protein